MDSSVDISPSELGSNSKRSGDHTKGNRSSGAFGNHPVGDRSSGAHGDHTSTTSAKNKDRIEMSKEHTYVQDLVDKNRVVVFSKTHCPHCTNSKSLLSGMGVEYRTVELDQLKDGSQVQNILGAITDAKTVPRIFIDGQCVGGNSELQNLDKTGQLASILKGAPEDSEVDPSLYS